MKILSSKGFAYEKPETDWNDWFVSFPHCERVIPTRNEDTQSQNLICLYTSSTDLLQSETRSKEQHKDN
jgi:hypothetical protein